MSTSVSSVAKHFPSAENGFTTTLASTISSGATTVPLNSVAGYANGEVVVFIVDPSDAAKKQTFTGTVDTSGVQITGVVWTSGTNQTHTAGATVVDYVDAAHISMVSKGLLVEHDQDGTHGAITADSVASAGAVSGTTISGTALTASANLSMTGGTFSLKGFWDGWVEATDTWTYASATTFTIAGVDRTAQFPVGTKVKLTQTSVKYFYVTASAFATDTTITVTGGSDYTLANAAITSPFFSNAATPNGFPQWFNWSTTYVNITAGNGTTVAVFSMSGKTVNLRLNFTLGNSSSVGTAPTFTLPVTSVNYAGPTTTPIGSFRVFDASGGEYVGSTYWLTTTTAIIQVWDSAATTLRPSNISSTNPMTWTTNDGFTLAATYEAA